MSINVRDLIKFMADHNAAHRSLIIRAAATSECVEPTIKVERPLYEEKNASLPVSNNHVDVINKSIMLSITLIALASKTNRFSVTKAS